MNSQLNDKNRFVIPLKNKRWTIPLARNDKDFLHEKQLGRERYGYVMSGHIGKCAHYSVSHLLPCQLVFYRDDNGTWWAVGRLCDDTDVPTFEKFALSDYVRYIKDIPIQDDMEKINWNS